MFKIPTRLPLLRPKHRQRFLLEENFNSTAIDTSKWTVTDTEGKFSVSGGDLVCAGGRTLAAPAWGDPGMTEIRSYARLAGLTFEFEWRRDGGGTTEIGIGFATTLVNPSWNQHIGFDLVPASSLTRIIDAGAPTTVPPNYSAASRRYRIVLKTAGALWYISDDGGVTWSLVWSKSTGTSTPVTPAYINYNVGFRSSYALVKQGSAKSPVVYSGTPAAPNPTLGSEILLDPGMEDNNAAWISSSSPTTQERSNEQAHAGTYSRKLVTDSVAEGVAQNVTLALGTWYQLAAWFYLSGGAGNSNLKLLNIGWNGNLGAMGAAWAQSVVTGRCTTDGADTAHFRSSASGTTFYVDDSTLKPLTLSTLLSLAANPGTKNGLVDSAPTLTAGTQCGHAIWVDDETNPAYGVFAYHDGTNANLVKLVNGTWTSLIAAAATYSAGAQLRTVAVGTSVALYYNGTIVGTVQTIADAGFGTKVCGFSTLSTNTPGAMVVEV